MKSASELSKRIRDAKKKREEQTKDLQEADIERQNETTMAEDHNTPKMRDEGNDESNAAEDKQEEQHNNHPDQNKHENMEKELLRHARLRKNMRK